MTDKKPASGKPASNPPIPTVRRASQPRPKKLPAKSAPTAPAELAAAESGHDARTTPSAPEASLTIQSEWPEPEAASSGGTGAPDSKRKRRRRKGKGQSAQAHAAPIATEESPSHDDAAEPTSVATMPVGAPKHTPAPPPPPRQPASRVKVDPETLARKAWKIFLAEVSEEGVALIGDQDARELARRCFRLAEIFIEEQARRVPSA